MGNTSPSSLTRVIDAIEFAADAHRAQRRKDEDATPYINHPIALLHILGCEVGIDDPEVLAAAAIHDYLEDCCGKHQEHIEQGRVAIRERFGEQVLLYVNALTDDKTLPKELRKRLQVAHAAAAPYGAKLVKLADKIANLRDIASRPPSDWPLEQRQEYYDWAATVIEQLRGTHPALEKLFDAEMARRPLAASAMPKDWGQLFTDNLNRNVLAEHDSAPLKPQPPRKTLEQLAVEYPKPAGWNKHVFRTDEPRPPSTVEGEKADD